MRCKAFDLSLQVKNELARLKQGRKCCQKAELTAFLRFSGSINISGKKISLNVITANPAVARRIFKLFKRLFGLNSELIVRRKSRLQKNNVYLIRIARTGRIFNVLGQLGLLKDGVLCRELPEAVHRKKCCRRAYLRGAFLAAGSNPESSIILNLPITSSMPMILLPLPLPSGCRQKKPEKQISGLYQRQ